MKISGIEEQVLIRRLLDGDQTAFELLFRFYYPGLVIFAKQMIFNPTEAENIVQDFFVTLWINRDKIKDTASLKGYFFTSVKNRAFNYLKSIKIKENIVEELKQLTESDLLFQPDVFVESELQDKIKAAMNKLPARTREVFMLSRIKGFSNDEIAEMLNISKRTVETQISNALKVMRTELKEYMFMLLVLGINLF